MVGVEVALGVILGVATVWYSLRMAAAIGASTQIVAVGDTSRISTVLFVGGAVVGGVTGWSVSHVSDGSTAVLLTVITLLFLVQGPLDLLTMRLSRPITLCGFAVIAATATIDTLFTNSWTRVVVAISLVAVVVALFGTLYRYSPKSLGFGDILLVAPLALTLGYLYPAHIPLWLLLASASGAAHGGVGRLRRSTPTIPFGPHLLGSSWLILVMSV